MRHNIKKCTLRDQMFELSSFYDKPAVVQAMAIIIYCLRLQCPHI